MHKIIHPIVILFALVCGCFVEDFDTGAFGSSSSSGAGATETSSSTTETEAAEAEHAYACRPLEDAPPSIDGFEVDLSTTEDGCPPTFCMSFSTFCVCKCSPLHPHDGTESCCVTPGNSQATSGSGTCGGGAGGVLTRCRWNGRQVEGEPVGTALPETCENGNYTCPAGYVPEPVEPKRRPKCSAECGGSCTGPGKASCWTSQGSCTAGGGYSI
jgi:hypothetical protein